MKEVSRKAFEEAYVKADFELQLAFDRFMQKFSASPNVMPGGMNGTAR